jgi:osmoprotectant transport system permease protein
MPARLFLEYVDPWINWDWLSAHVELVLQALGEHIELTLIAIALGLLISVPLGVIVHRRRGPRLAVLGFFGAFYTIPSLALFALLIPFTHISGTTAEIPLVGYNVLILVRNVLVGLDAVPRDVLDAALGLRYRDFLTVALVVDGADLFKDNWIFAGLRVATVSTIGIVTITAVIGLGGLGSLIDKGLIENFRTPVTVATVLSIVLAVAADLLIAGAQRVALPWSREASR